MQQRISENANAGFYGLGIAPALLEILGRLHFKIPTPIQAQAIPVAIEGKDIIGIAQTGTGKTLAFGIPMIQRLAQIKAQGLIVLPTRELALQVDETLKKIGHGLGLRTAVLIGGLAIEPQARSLAKKPHIVVATPGRLIDHLNQKNLRLDSARVVVLDEADRMLDMGFAPQIKKIFHELPKDRQTMLFSATMPPGIMKMASASMKLPVRVEIAPAGTTVERVTQELFIVPREQKISLLEKLFETHQGSTLLFTRTKYGARKVVHQIRAMGVSAAEIHSNRSLNQRREALDGFKSGKYRVLVATDIASRGIDVAGIELVLNFDLPSTSDDYVHRIGRTARAGARGHAITFVMPGEQGEIRAIESLIRKTLPVSQLPKLAPARIFEFQRQLQARTAPESRRHAGPPRRYGGRSGGHRRFGKKHF